MNEFLWTLVALALVALAWAYMNHWYRRIYGRPLRWPYFWAAHGAVMFRRQLKNWERR